MQFAAAILVDQSGRLLLQLRDGNTHIDPHKWCLPGGSIDEGEEPMRAAHRELLEETGLQVEKLSLFWHGIGPSAAFPGAIGEFSVFYSTTAATQDDVVCGEGAAMRFIDAAEVPKLEFGEMYTKIVSEFLTSPQYQSLSDKP